MDSCNIYNNTVIVVVLVVVFTQIEGKTHPLCLLKGTYTARLTCESPLKILVSCITIL